MRCRTPGCGADVPLGERDRRFCERCGWPLAEGQVSLDPPTVRLVGETSATFTLQVDNVGLGLLDWELGTLSKGLQMAPGGASGGSIEAGQSVGIQFTLDPTVLPADREFQVAVPLRLRDRVGAHGDDFRQCPPEDTFREVTVPLGVSRPRYGPLLLPWRTLLFGGGVHSVGVTLRNEGEVEMEITAQASAGYTVEIPGQPRGERVSVALDPGFRETLTVFCPSSPAAGDGVLTLRVPGFPEYLLDLLKVQVSPPPPPSERWIIAVDFGTTKSAVMVLDNFTQGAEPEPIWWPRPGGQEDEKWVPSAVAWDRGRPSRFGWQVGLTESGDHIVRHLKMRLQEDNEQVQKSVVYFLKRIFEQVANRYGPEIFGKARLVFTLPVLDNADSYEEQRRRTLERVLEAGADYHIREEQCDFYKEPECAAMDFLHELQSQVVNGEASRLLEPGSWLCVLDMGGGTTDVTFARFDMAEDGTPTFDRFHSLGFPNWAGDHLDEEIYRWCLGHWHRRGRLKTDQEYLSEEGLKALSEAEEIHLKGEEGGPYDPLKRSQALDEICTIKEQIYGSTPPQPRNLDMFTLEDNHITLEPEQLRPLLSKMAEAMFDQGIPEPSSGGEYPSVRMAMEHPLNLAAHQIQLLCLTGGTCRIPEFEEFLREMALTWPKTQRLVTPEHIRLNVVRGAARRPALRIQDRLFCDIQLALGKERTTLPKGSVAGASKKFEKHFFPQETAILEVRAVLPGQDPRPLFSYEITNEDPEPTGLHLEVQLQYAAQKLLKIRAVWLTRPEREALPWLTIQQMPAI